MSCFRGLAAFLMLPALAMPASLAEIRTVYLFPMANGLDQYLAERLTRDHVLTVITDPKAADAVITDRLGASFEYQLLAARPELRPPAPPKKVKEKAKDKDGKDKDAKDKDKDSGDDDSKDAKKEDEKLAPVVSTFGAARGTVFLVDARTQQVVWSTYQPPRKSGQRDLAGRAGQIAKSLEKDINPPAKNR